MKICALDKFVAVHHTFTVVKIVTVESNTLNVTQTPLTEIVCVCVCVCVVAGGAVCQSGDSVATRRTTTPAEQGAGRSVPVPAVSPAHGRGSV